jgi:TolB-like protein
MRHMKTLFTTLIAAGTALVLGAQGQPPSDPAQTPPRQSGEVIFTITGAPGLPPKYAVPDFLALTSDPETVAAAKTIGQVLWDDLNFEREFYLIPRDTYRTIPAATSIEQVPLDQWKQLGADGLIVGTVRKTAAGVAVQVRLIEVSAGAPRSRRNTAARSRIRGSTRTPHPTKSINSSARCAVLPAPSWPSRPTATASG